MEGEEKNREKYVHTFHDYLNFCRGEKQTKCCLLFTKSRLSSAHRSVVFYINVIISLICSLVRFKISLLSIDVFESSIKIIFVSSSVTVLCHNVAGIL